MDQHARPRGGSVRCFCDTVRMVDLNRNARPAFPPPTPAGARAPRIRIAALTPAAWPPALPRPRLPMVREVPDRLRVCRATVYRMIDEGRLPAIRVSSGAIGVAAAALSRLADHGLPRDAQAARHRRRRSPRAGGAPLPASSACSPRPQPRARCIRCPWGVRSMKACVQRGCRRGAPRQ